MNSLYTLGANSFLYWILKHLKEINLDRDPDIGLDVINQIPGYSRIFEYGSGSSTIYLGKCHSVVCSVETDRRFARAVKKK